MEKKKKESKSKGLIVLVVILLLACAGMSIFIFVNKDKLTEKGNAKTNDSIQLSYYETKQEGSEKYNLELINTGKNNGYFSLRYVSAYESGSEAPLTNGYYSIKNNNLFLEVGPYKNEEEFNNDEANYVFKKLTADVTQKAQSYYKMYSTTYNENEISIGNKTFYKVK